MKITFSRVYDLHESIAASGLPMVARYNEGVFGAIVSDMDHGFHISSMDRAFRLASAQDGSGHKNFLSGILVSFNVTATQVWWMQFERYHFAQIVSSMSKMHRLKEMIETGCLEFHDKVFENGEELLNSLALYIDKNDVVDEEELVYNCPMGLELTARVTTNYLQLRTIYVQRRNHKLQEWCDFCAWIEGLPLADKLITVGCVEERSNA